MKDYQVSEKKLTQTWGVLDRQAAMKLAGTEIPQTAMKAETRGGRILAVWGISVPASFIAACLSRTPQVCVNFFSDT